MEKNDDGIMNERKIGLITDIGKRRKINQDSVIALNCKFGLEQSTGEKYFFALADGMGGLEKGEMASLIAISVVTKEIVSKIVLPQHYPDLLKKSIISANNKIKEYANENNISSIGSTLICGIIDKDELLLAHLGDSRAYIVDKKNIVKITKDHSYVQTLVDDGQITEEEAEIHPQKNIVTKSLGIQQHDPDIVSHKLLKNEILLVCSDGLSNMVSEEIIKEIISKNGEPQESCRELVNVANKFGGFDNISIIMIN